MKNEGICVNLTQFVAILEQKQCCRCAKRATYFSQDPYFCYCDEHFPYKKEKGTK